MYKAAGRASGACFLKNRIGLPNHRSWLFGIAGTGIEWHKMCGSVFVRRGGNVA